MAQVKKISVGKVYGKIKIADLMQSVDGKLVGKGPVLVMRVGGLATGIKEGVSDFGPWKALVGDFAAFSGATGEEMRAPYCFLPDVALNPLTVALAQSNTAGVRFLIDVYAQYDESSQTQYTYTFEPVVKPVGSDPVAELLAQAAPLQIGGKAVGGLLEAPKEDAPQPAPETGKPAAKGKGK